ncbi:DUF4199 domain-containing protein [Parapedobacter tibetensis]|uniref:DUF4199 domain-containing protein n=1 Tax=Parapedobacter tibetensis TaxID=2972951 RepID=UPI00214D6EDA|nr:DUF4199 domain-containing protein [Parapedobacter tibetensis]
MKIAIYYGILFAFAIFIWAVIESLVGLHDRYIQYHEYLSYFFAVPSVAIMFWGIRSSRNQSDSRTGFRKAFMAGLGITLVVTMLCPLVWYVFCVFVNPTFLNNMMHYAVETKGMDAQIAALRFSLSNHILVSTISTSVIGVVIAFVIAIIVARRKN